MNVSDAATPPADVAGLRLSRWWDAVFLLLVGLMMLAWSWLRWPDALIDYGRELYVPWQLAEGKVLYRDIMHVQGPLSPYLNSLWFRLFGTSFLTLALCNLAILAGLVCLLYRLLNQMSSRWTTLLALFVFLTLFAFGEFVAVGNYNYVCPYRHEATHGIALALLAIAGVFRYQKNPRLPTLAGIGFVLGLLFLTKGEIFVAGLGAVAAGLLLTTLQAAPEERHWGQRLGWLGGAWALPLLAAFLLLGSALPLAEAWRGVLGSWPATFAGSFMQSEFVLWGTGRLNLAQNLEFIRQWSVYYLIFFLTAMAVSLGAQRAGKMRVLIAVSFFFLVFWGVPRLPIQWKEFVHPLPVLMAALTMMTFFQFFQARREKERAQALLARFTFMVFASLLLLKMGLNPRIFHYGFVLAMPAMLLFLVVLLEWIPRRLERQGGHGWTFRAASLGILSLIVFWHLQILEMRWLAKSHTVSSGRDRFFANHKADIINETLAKLSQYPTNDTLAAVPEGAMLNYLSRRPNPTPYIDFVPTELFYYGEKKVTDTLAHRPPERMALVHRDTSDYGLPYFGRDYGRQLAAWISANYQKTALIGSPPLRNQNFGILLLQRKAPAAQTTIMAPPVGVD